MILAMDTAQVFRQETAARRRKLAARIAAIEALPTPDRLRDLAAFVSVPVLRNVNDVDKIIAMLAEVRGELLRMADLIEARGTILDEGPGNGVG